jgi:hypothetical protein
MVVRGALVGAGTLVAVGATVAVATGGLVAGGAKVGVLPPQALNPKLKLSNKIVINLNLLFRIFPSLGTKNEFLTS